MANGTGTSRGFHTGSRMREIRTSGLKRGRAYGDASLYSTIISTGRYATFTESGSLFKDDARHREIVRTLSMVRVGMTRDELIRALKVTDGGAWTNCLDELCESGFVRRYTAMGRKAKGTVYQLIDGFTLFHFRFIEGRSNPDEHFWTLAQKSQPVVVWKGLAYERLCLLHVRQIRMALGISGVLTDVFSWRHDADDTYPHLTMVTTEGVARNSYCGIVQSEVTLDDLFRA